jgi:amino acid adenylation domain-containing protein
VHEAAERHRFVLTAHHIVCDGWSSAVLFSDLGLLYRADRVGIPAQLPPAASYEQYVAGRTSAAYRTSAVADEEYWATQFADGAPVLDLPLSRPRPATKTYRSERELLRIDADLYDALKRTGARAGATLFTTLVAAFEALLHRLSGQLDFVVGIPLAEQPQLENPALVAHCVNTVPLRAAVDPTAPFSDHLRHVGRDLTRAQDHSRVTFGSLVTRLRLPRDRSRTPLVETTFTIDRVGAPFDFGDVTITDVATPKSYGNFDLQVNVVDSGADAVVECDYNVDLFDREAIRRWLSHYETLMRAAVAYPDTPLVDLPLLNEADLHTILDEWNDTAVELGDEKRLHRLFEAQVRSTPDAVAVVDADEQVSYAELNARANRLAHHLRSLGVGPGAQVGVCLERRASLVAALFGVLKAGGAYVPLDPAYPSNRIAFMLQDSRAGVVVTQDDFVADLADSGAQPLVFDGATSSADPKADSDPEGGAGERDLAYVIYTSGSTGVPKGVAIEHRSAGTLVHWARSVFSDRDISGVLASTSVCFDLSVFELFFPLAFGGRVILADHALEVGSLAARADVTLVNTVPSAAAEIVRAAALPPSVQTVCLAGEPLPTRLVDDLYATGHVERVFDLYGPSEDTTYSTFTPREPGAAPTIGRPIANTRAYVLDPQRRPVPVGVVGELYLAGDGLARGYLHRDELTAERFVTVAFDGRPPERAYRTGDLARYRSDGRLEFLGRSDHQVKIRGFRIELGEVEAALAEAPEVDDVVVVAREDQPGDKRLVAYVATTRRSEDLVEKLRSALRTNLPDHMVPAHFVLLDALPLTPNGKVDRAALPMPHPERSAAGGEHVQPRTGTEERIARIWSDALGIESPGVHDDFFDLGGHSLKAAQVVTTLRSDFGVGVAMRHLFEHPTIAGLAKLVDLLAVSAVAAPQTPDTAREEVEI